MISINIETHPDSPVQVVMQNHEVLATYTELPPGTRLATEQDFLTAEGNISIGMPYFWQRVMETTYNASRMRQDTFDMDLRQAIKGKRVWVLTNF